ncbi:SGNH hydrolase-type esterase domain-containing protein [Jimgerdemannia flammicorona]|uniref:SGNH hydrolase-type esterase domain-containing protein n=1 Tax=Jimgerdemannia flammicorona TaxID=994334 RepID=A0A433DI31_9FUNG|nr:SGNH hydrolase-type esterase domain-containing protein [Jimgerdemannia flammicorona]
MLRSSKYRFVQLELTESSGLNHSNIVDHALQYPHSSHPGDCLRDHCLCFTACSMDGGKWIADRSEYQVSTFPSAMFCVARWFYGERYVGRWDSTNVNAFWSGPYLRVRFTNTTTLKVKLDNSASFHSDVVTEVTVVYRIDSGSANIGPTALTLNTSGVFDITPSGSLRTSRIYSLQIGGLGWRDVIQFRGLQFDNGGYTIHQNFPTKLIEFVGDSITAGATDTLETWSDYSFLTGEKLGVEHTQIAYPAICLTNYGTCPNQTMSDYFFSARNPGYDFTPWDFSKYKADALSIMIGQNDHGHGPAPSALFQSTLTTLLTGIRAKHPLAHIFILLTFRGFYETEIVASIAERNTAGDNALTFVNTTGWLNSTDFLIGAGPHPSDAGHRKVAKLLIPIFKSVLRW